MKKNIEELIYNETEKRLNIMASKEYEFPKKATKLDYMIIVISIIICVFFMVLCMIGVIK